MTTMVMMTMTMVTTSPIMIKKSVQLDTKMTKIGIKTSGEIGFTKSITPNQLVNSSKMTMLSQ